ncbi:hypothetical protein [Bradyrhizobium neotropicale]|uniref:hypothetical protein n=1 Tax=Bradyrhizobium neotropicale TaxID=1497615 RepID=UPI001AD6092F|nr:hypothetical protein [Bradyrhizobium neotropicale]MBO4221941.1 hypothetical protein [Bradyrhizobium neotropicale]
MKYNQPYGVSDPNAPFINGNPSTGTAGSIPPAASIEYPQREIVNLITHAGLLNPDNADLSQLAKSVQSMLLNAQDDAGTANAYQVTMHPAPNAYYKYLMVIMKVGNDNTGPSVCNVNALGAKPIIRIDGSQLDAGALRKNSIVALMYDGAAFQMVWASGGVSGMPVYLTAPKHLYVDANIGSDTAYDGTTAAVVAGTIHGPFQTIQKAVNTCYLYNLNGFDITIHVANGAYTGNVVLGQTNGAGTVYLVGNNTTPSACTVTSTIQYGCAFVQTGGIYNLAGFRCAALGTNALDGINCNGGRQYLSGTLQFGPCGRSHFSAGYTGYQQFNLGLLVNVESGANAASHLYAQQAAVLTTLFPAIGNPWPALQFLGPVNFSVGFVQLFSLANSAVVYSSFAGVGSVTGPKFNVSTNAVCVVNGNGVSYYPGSTPGVVATGGQYV